MARNKYLLTIKLLSWLGLIVLFAVVSVSAMSKRGDTRCDRVLVRFKNDHNLGFVQSRDIVKEVNDANPSWSGQKASQIRFNIIENSIKSNQYVKNAELYLDNQNQINVMVEPKNPIARVQSEYGAYYLSENWDRMSLSDYYSKRIVHISGRVNGLTNPKTFMDTFINSELKTLIGFMNMNTIWVDAIDQIYISPNGKIELILVFAQPTIQLGYIDKGFEKRMEKIENFFKTVPNKMDISKYSDLNFEFKNQVVAKKKETENIVSSN